MRTLTKRDNTFVVVGEWFDKVNGNTYYDCTITVNADCFFVPYQYGYDATNEWNIKELLNQVGFRIRTNKRVREYCKVYTQKKLKRNLITK